jgi:phospholipase/carboxylesterase
MSAPPGPVFGPAATAKPDSAVIFLHGYGASGDDLIGLAPFFAQSLPATVFHAPHAPEPWEGGFFGGRQWFSLAGYDPDLLRRDPQRMGAMYERMAAGAAKAAGVIDAIIDRTAAHYGLGAGRIALVGFSQGTMMALHVGLRRPEPLGAVVGFSGAILGATKLKDEIRSRPPILLIHGEADPVVPVEALAEIKRALDANAVAYEAMTVPGLQHGIDQSGADRAAAFLKQHLSPA